mmetsp:Transcript_6972/g.10008  ORF Transcript_6972/g.10008 Transcript_6972/m.10008 type:complete len:312 (-) Transcript_6972:154-1089(-)|eukprot:CAMPEP_0184862710 /NCGR_PEP_ID=MMETSP0580-20130426/7115_1 /TAXON_ID=1118495 /ORGANISM="Dactyliosolen fragilissimus" /LENGTH=311 /DNA_ID=CAMNT_0027360671 /DNA_START=189 /DNA_END=1124 /DNA_ORIENTATION=-
MASYLVDLAYLINLRSKSSVDEKLNSKVANCINRLTEMRIIIDKIRPMEKKMRYHIDKLLTAASGESAFAAVTREDDSDDGKQDSGTSNISNDPLSFRPNPSGMHAKDEEESYSEEEFDGDDENKGLEVSRESGHDEYTGEDDDDLKLAKNVVSMAKNESLDSTNEKSGLYRAPHLESVQFVEKEKEEERRERLLKKQNDRMRKSELIQTLRAQFGEAPDEDDYMGGSNMGKQREASRRLAEKEAERTKLEEEQMTRFTTSRKDKKERKRVMREEASNLNAIADLGNLTAGVKTAFGNEIKHKKRKKHKKY